MTRPVLRFPLERVRASQPLAMAIRDNERMRRADQARRRQLLVASLGLIALAVAGLWWVIS